MNIRVGSLDQIQANTSFPDLMADPVVIGQMQEMAISSINGEINGICDFFVQMGTQKLFTTLLKTEAN